MRGLNDSISKLHSSRQYRRYSSCFYIFFLFNRPLGFHSSSQLYLFIRLRFISLRKSNIQRGFFSTIEISSSKISSNFQRECQRWPMRPIINKSNMFTFNKLLIHRNLHMAVMPDSFRNIHHLIINRNTININRFEFFSNSSNGFFKRRFSQSKCSLMSTSRHQFIQISDIFFWRR